MPGLSERGDRCDERVCLRKDKQRGVPGRILYVADSVREGERSKRNMCTSDRSRSRPATLYLRYLSLLDVVQELYHTDPTRQTHAQGTSHRSHPQKIWCRSCRSCRSRIKMPRNI
ncbi:unnamed protein product [Laminaria digitata]